MTPSKRARFVGGATLLIGLAVTTMVLAAPCAEKNTTADVAVSDEERALQSRVDYLEWQNRRLLGHLQAWPERCTAEAAASPEADTHPARPSSADARQIASADAAYDRAVRDADLRGLIELGSELLNSGEPGYEKFTELATRLLNEDNEKLELLWGDPEASLGPVAIAVARDPEPLLRYALYLDRQDADEIPHALRHVHHEFMDGPAAMLLQGTGGNDQELESDYLAYFESRHRASGTLPSDAYQVLAGNSDPAAGDLLSEVAMSSDPTVDRPALMRALARRGDPQAQATLSQIVARYQQEDERFRSQLDPEDYEMLMKVGRRGAKTQELAERLLATFPGS